MFIIKDTKENIKYIYLVLTYITNLEFYAVGTTIKGISKENLISIKLPIPPKEIQEQIVTQCDYYDNLIKILTDENNRLLNNKIIELAFNFIQSNHEHSEESSTNNIENIESENEESDESDESDEEEQKIIKHNQIQYYLIKDKIYKIKKDKSQGELFGSYIDGNVEEIIEIKTKKTKSVVKNNR